MKDHIAISLEWQGKQVDLGVPSHVTAHRLIELISQAFKANNQNLPNQWHFIVKGKSVALGSGLTLKELGLGNGEILQLIVGEENESI
ncbi:MAG: EsaB/YukD family protein [Streptococcaceae bacterium]|nr:EsaB/YukD family protein [Streptococcaceae bacterium]MCL2681198.1 EsaB/YukD family protein [Streptococcaceae bacterium]MCL2858642.1 EsaB/YukD family protein [Streptococcaceae bacterium]